MSSRALTSEIERYLAKWTLVRDGEPIETPTSVLQAVRRDGERAMFKLLKPSSDEQGAAALLRYYDGHGAVRLYAADENALLMERALGKRCLREMALSGGDLDAAGILADTLTKLQAARDQPVPSTLTPLSERFDSLFERESKNALLGRCAEMARHLLSTEGERVPLHGDLHHGNVLDGAPRGWLAIDPKALIGERTYDVANLLRNPAPYGALVQDPERMRRLAGFYAERLGIERQRILDFAFAHAGLSAAWDIEDGLDSGYSLRCAEVLASLAEGP